MKKSDPFKHLNILAHFWNRTANPKFRAICKRPIFVVGCGHSGTTLLLRIVGAHPNIHAIVDESSSIAKKRYYQLREFDFEAYHHQKQRWVEKTPIHIRHLKRIFKCRPEAKVLIILRDGRDVADSIRARKGSFEIGVKRWVKDNQSSEPWWNDPRVKVIKYENLVSEFEKETRSIMEFLGEEYSHEIRDFHVKVKHPSLGEACPDSVTQGDHLKYRMWQVTQPLFDGRGRWQKHLSAEDKILFKEIAGDMLIRYGYAADNQW